MAHTEGAFTGTDGASIHYQCWRPGAEPRGLLLIAHGAAEHGGRYGHFARYLVGKGFAVAALDHYGHGKSDGGRCCLRKIDDHVQNLESFRELMGSSFPGVPLTLLGHSMGGLIACLYLLDYPDTFESCILSAPGIKTELEPPWYQMAVIRFLSLLAPDMGVLQLDASGVSRLPEEVERYRDDPLNYTGKLSARMVAEGIRGMSVVQSRAGEIRLPLLIMHGGADTMTSQEGSEFLYETVASGRKQMKIFPRAFHEIIHEPERDAFYLEVEHWLSGGVAE